MFKYIAHNSITPEMNILSSNDHACSVILITDIDITLTSDLLGGQIYFKTRQIVPQPQGHYLL